MKIVFVVPDMAGGGTERVISLLANEYVKQLRRPSFPLREISRHIRWTQSGNGKCRGAVWRQLEGSSGTSGIYAELF